MRQNRLFIFGHECRGSLTRSAMQAITMQNNVSRTLVGCVFGNDYANMR